MKRPALLVLARRIVMPRAERRAAPEPDRIARAAKGPLVARGDRPTHPSDEGSS